MKFILCGRSRSGTTITYEILNKHPEVNITNQANRYFDPDFEGGDKVGTPSTQVLNELAKDPEFKFIFIYRDCRDSVTSGMKKGKVWLGGYRQWKDPNPRINSEHWGKSMKRWFTFKKTLEPEQYLQIRFEDYIDDPWVNGELMAEFLGVDPAKMQEIERELIVPEKMHVGDYVNYVPDWERTFDPLAIEMMKEYGYI